MKQKKRIVTSHLLTTKEAKESKKHCRKSHFTKERPVLSKGWFYKLPPHIVIILFMKYVLLSFGFFLVQNVSSFSRVARYTPSLSCILTSKISSKSNKANL